MNDNGIEIECPKCSGKVLLDYNKTEYSCQFCDWDFEKPFSQILEEHDRAINAFKSPSWDEYFFTACCSAASRSKCLSRRLGCVLVDPTTNIIISTGYNGPARGIPQCGPERMRKDHVIRHRLDCTEEPVVGTLADCPRHRLGFSSSVHLDLCPSVHAERNTIYNAANVGTRTRGTVLYTSDIIPCSKCLSALIQAGIIGVVCSAIEHYDVLSRYVLENSEIKIRKYELSRSRMIEIFEAVTNRKGE